MFVMYRTDTLLTFLYLSSIIFGNIMIRQNHLISKITIYVLVFSTLMFSGVSYSFGKQDTYRYLVTAQSLAGYTGNILTPSPHTVNERELSFGIHRFYAGFAYGLNSQCEAGFALDLKEFSEFSIDLFRQKMSEIALHTKYQLLRRRHPFYQEIDFSFGFHYKKHHEYYLVAAKDFVELDNTILQAGFNYNNSPTNEREWKFEHFFCVAYPTKYSFFLLDWSSSTNESNIGWRVLLSPDIRLDLFIVDVGNIKTLFDNFVFGLTLIA